MKKITLCLSICLLLFVLVHAQTLRSPGGKFMMVFALTSDGTPTYTLNYKDRVAIKSSKLGLELKNDKQSLLNAFEITRIDTSSFDEPWKPVWGEVATIRNHYNEMAVTLSQKESGRQMIIRFRLFDDGLGFRYEFPSQKNLVYFVIKEERTQFAMTGDHTAFSIA